MKGMKKRLAISLIIMLTICACYGCKKTEESSTDAEVSTPQAQNLQSTQTANNITDNSEEEQESNLDIDNEIQDEDFSEESKVGIEELKKVLADIDGTVDISGKDYPTRQKSFNKSAKNKIDLIFYIDSDDRENAFKIHLTKEPSGYQAVIADSLNEFQEYSEILAPCAIYLNTNENIVLEGSDVDRNYHYYEFEGKKLKVKKDGGNVDIGDSNSTIVNVSDNGTFTIEGGTLSLRKYGKVICSANIPVPQKVVSEESKEKIGYETCPYIDVDNRMILIRTYKEKGKFKIIYNVIAEDVKSILGLISYSGKYIFEDVNNQICMVETKNNSFANWMFTEKNGNESLKIKTKVKKLSQKELNSIQEDDITYAEVNAK